MNHMIIYTFTSDEAADVTNVGVNEITVVSNIVCKDFAEFHEALCEEDEKDFAYFICWFSDLNVFMYDGN